ncbi:glycosyltransferase family 4 protein [Patescibacteria group bacterium]|nr:glycosyltransferase family 4 protein [Patescibacteria group bacterium]
MKNEKSNIAVFSFAYAPFEGGAEVALREIMRRLPAFSFTVFTAHFDERSSIHEVQDHVEIIRLGKPTRRRYGLLVKKVRYIFQAWQAAEERHRRARFDAIWVVMASYGGIAALLFKMKHPSIPMLLTVQEGDSERHLKYGKFGLVGFFGKVLLHSADAIQVISGYLRDFALRKGASEPITVVPNGVDEKLFATAYGPDQLRTLRNYLEIGDDYVIVTTSRLVPKNGVDILIKAVARFRERRPNVKCLIIGGGPERQRLERLSRRLGVERNIVFLGQMAQNDLPLYFAIADMFARPSRSEGLGNSFLEAMAAGIPVIGTPVGGIVDFLKDGETGFLAQPEDPESVAAKMHEILDNEARTQAIVARARELVERSYTWDVVARMMRTIFDQLINL